MKTRGSKILPVFGLFMLLLVVEQAAPVSAGPSVNGDPFIDDLHSNAFVSQSPYWSEVKVKLTNGRIDEAVADCRKVMARRPLDVDMHCLYALALEMKLRSSAYDPKLFDECVKEWTKVAKYKVLRASDAFDHIGEGEVFVQNHERKAMANRHLVALVGRAPKIFESEEAFLKKSIRTSTSVAAKIKGKDSF